MKWTSKEVEDFLKSREYIDTAVIPLIPIAINEIAKSYAQMKDFVEIVANELERQFKGRVLLLPSFMYIANNYQKEHLETLVNHLKENGMKHIVLLTCDNYFQGENVTMLPNVPLEYMEESYQKQLVRDQVAPIIQMLVTKWS